MDHPVLATSTDGVGTKVAIAQAMDVHDTIGFDLVGMVVDDLVVCGAEPLFMTDYIACGRVRPGADRGHRARASPRPAPRPAAPCSVARPPSTRVCSDPTSTTSPARPPESSSAIALLGPDRVRPGDVVRRHRLLRTALQRLLAGPPGVLPTPAGRWTATCRELGRTLGEELLEPTRIYSRRLPGADRRGRGARDEPHHRRRVWPTTWPGCCPDDRRSGSIGRAGSPRRSSGWSRRLGQVSRARPRGDPQPGRRDGRRAAGGRRWIRRSGCSPASGDCRPGSAARWPRRGSGTRAAGQPVRPAPRPALRPRSRPAWTWQPCYALVAFATRH